MWVVMPRGAIAARNQARSDGAQPVVGLSSSGYSGGYGELRHHVRGAATVTVAATRDWSAIAIRYVVVEIHRIGVGTVRAVGAGWERVRTWTQLVLRDPFVLAFAEAVEFVLGQIVDVVRHRRFSTRVAHERASKNYMCAGGYWVGRH